MFLPAGLRLVAVLLFGLYGVIGLFFGAMVTGLPLGLDTQTTITISLISAVNPYLAINTTKYCLKIDRLMTGLNAKHLLSISFFAALFNGLSHNLYFHTHIHETTLENCITMFAGDFLGSLILLYAFALGIKLLRKTVKVQSNPAAK